MNFIISGECFGKDDAVDSLKLLEQTLIMRLMDDYIVVSTDR
jgi:hypothetical protein